MIVGNLATFRVVSMTLGLPMVVSRADALAVPLPASIDDIYLSAQPGQDGSQPRDVLPQSQFFIESLRLYRITEEVLSAMYSKEEKIPSGTKPGISAAEKLASFDFNTVLKIEASLQHWHESLPDQLRQKPNSVGSTTDSVVWRQANILHLRQVNSNNFSGDARTNIYF
jgi:hypothetical protein